jgi:hypothetical protein
MGTGDITAVTYLVSSIDIGDHTTIASALSGASILSTDRVLIIPSANGLQCDVIKLTITA